MVVFRVVKGVISITSHQQDTSWAIKWNKMKVSSRYTYFSISDLYRSWVYYSSTHLNGAPNWRTDVMLNRNFQSRDEPKRLKGTCVKNGLVLMTSSRTLHARFSQRVYSWKGQRNFGTSLIVSTSSSEMSIKYQGLFVNNKSSNIFVAHWLVK